MKDLSIFWFRRDLRLNDNAGLYEALSNAEKVLPIFIFDTAILDKLPEDDARVNFIHQELQSMQQQLKAQGHGTMAIYKGKPVEVFKALIEKFPIKAVYANKDYEPYARERDESVRDLLLSKGITLHTYKDHVIFEQNEVVKDDGLPYVVYTPYMKKWKSQFSSQMLDPFHSEKQLHQIASLDVPNLSLEDIGFRPSSQVIAPYDVSSDLIQAYEETRNFPAKDATSRLGPHLRFGTVSIRQMMTKATAEDNEVFWQELIWREFFQQILWHFPHTRDKAFKSKYDRIEWRNNEEEFQRWCDGKTGYPLVDAGMRQLNKTGFMHNRIRMLVGSFLCKHLLIDWRWGEAYFAEKLHDYEMASNVGNWQWVAGSGVDAAPYFRIFNPTSQIKKFDKDLTYIKKWVPEFQELQYPEPIVDHKYARERCLNTYKNALN
jgi:deoxyribodipyrimidine photo-lyase